MPQVIVPMIVAFVVSVITQVAMKLLTPKPKKPGLQYYGNYSGTAEPVRLIYGRVRVGGMQVVPPFCTNNEGKALHVVIAYCAHEIEQYAMHYFDNAEIDPADITPITGVLDDGQVTAGDYNKKANIRPYLGTSTQTADYILRTVYPGAFDINFRGRGIAYIAYTLWFANVYKSVPQLGALIYGKKCYDPRTGTTPSIATSNPALILRDYLVNEVGFPTAAVDDTLVQAAANICDQSVDVPPGPSTQQKRYQCNVMLSAGDNWEDNVRMLLATMRGVALYRDGVWRIYAGAWDTPTVTITADAWVSPTTVNISSPMEERWNAVTGWYMAADKAYQRTPCFPRRNSTYETQDGGEQFMQDLELHGVTDEYEAQRHAEFELRRSRNQLTISGRLRPEYIKLATWDTVYVTDEYYGWSNKTFRVISMEMGADGTVDVNLQEEGSATWTDLARSEYGAITTTATIDPGASLPEARTNFTITPGPGTLDFRWDVDSAAMPGEVTRILEASVSSDAAAASEIWRGAANRVNLVFPTVATKAYWLQGVVDSYVGPYTPNTFGTYAAAQSGGAGVPGSNGTDGVSVTLSLPSLVVPASSNGFVPAAAMSAAYGAIQVFQGATNVTSYASTRASSQFQVVGEANSAHGSPWASNSKGAYHVTSLTGLNGTLWLEAVYSGTTYLRPFNMAKSTGGNDGQSALSLTLTPPSVIVACSYDGSPKTGELPRTVSVKALLGGTDVTTLCTMVRSASACSFSYATGSISGVLEAITANDGYVDITATFSNQNTKTRLPYVKSSDGVPGGVQYLAVTAGFSGFYTNTSWPTSGPSGSVNATQTGKLRLSAGANWQSKDSTTLDFHMKMQYRLSGGAWADVASSVSSGGNPSFWNGVDMIQEYGFLQSPPNSSYIELTGLNSSALYDFQVLTRRSTTSSGDWVTKYATFDITVIGNGNF